MKLNEVLLGGKDSPVSRLDPAGENEPIVLRAVRQVLQKGDKLLKRVKTYDGKTGIYYLTHVITDSPSGQRLIFTNTKGQQSFVKIDSQTDDNWTIEPDTKLKGFWNMTRIEARHAVNEDSETPLIYDLMKQLLNKGEAITVKFNTTKNNSPMVKDSDTSLYRERGVMEQEWQLKVIGIVQGRPLIALSYYTDPEGGGGDHDTISLYADVMDDRFELVKLDQYDKLHDKSYTWVLKNRK